MLTSFDVDSVVQILMLFVISLQLFVLHKTFKADHERRKKQSTVEYINDIRVHYQGVTNKLIDKYGSNAINLDQLDDETKGDIKELLSILEHMGVGVNTGVYDFDILQRMSGSYLVNRYHQLYPYINEYQKKTLHFILNLRLYVRKLKMKEKRNISQIKGISSIAPNKASVFERQKRCPLLLEAFC